MCGICGFWDPSGAAAPDRDVLARMIAALTHRGPDDSGAFVDDGAAVALGFRRLSIIDLSAAGHQPMSNGGEDVWIVFNGEVYNFAGLRAELEANGCEFRSQTDTEVVLNAYQAWGEACIGRFTGMFAFVIWDRRRRRLFAARDRLGIKPLYYSTAGGRFAFASELKALLEMPGFDRRVDAAALRSFLQHGYVSAPASIFRSARSLPPGCTLTWTAGEPAPRIERYWRVESFYAPVARDEGEAGDELDGLLRRAVLQHLVSDVPLGAFLSGGLDSSLVVALMRQATSAEVRTFTVGFDEAAYDESRFAERVARHLGTTHTALRVTAVEAKAAVAKLPVLYDEPFADSSQIPTYLVSKLTREHVTVALSGDGGDELFCGYSRYADMASWQRLWHIPSFARALAGGALRALPVPERVSLAARGLAMSTPSDFYDFYVSVWRPHEIAALAPALGQVNREAATDGMPATAPLLDTLMLRDFLGYLPNDILTKVDSCGRIRDAPAALDEVERRNLQVSAAACSPAVRAGRAHRAPQTGIRDPARRLAPRRSQMAHRRAPR